MDSLLERVVVDPDVCHGQARIRGTRIMVWQVLAFLANGDSIEQVLGAYPGLTREDALACLEYASQAARERILPVGVAP